MPRDSEQSFSMVEWKARGHCNGLIESLLKDLQLMKKSIYMVERHT